MREYAELGIDTFILSGYPHLEEAYRVAELLFPKLGVSAPGDAAKLSDARGDRRYGNASDSAEAYGGARIMTAPVQALSTEQSTTSRARRGNGRRRESGAARVCRKDSVKA